jgi:hypothetical protein
MLELEKDVKAIVSYTPYTVGGSTSTNSRLSSQVAAVTFAHDRLKPVVRNDGLCNRCLAPYNGCLNRCQNQE